MAERSHGVKYTPWKAGDKVWLSAKNLIIPIPKKKLGPKRYGPFPIKAVLSPITFTLQLPEQWRIHPTFHASELSSYCETDVHGLNFLEPPPDIINEEEEYEVEAMEQGYNCNNPSSACKVVFQDTITHAHGLIGTLSLFTPS
jgi:hypothetical protein